jgi:hypothetical protein
VPRLHVEFGVLAVGDGLPAGGENFLDGVGDVEFVGGAEAESIDAGAEGFGRTNGVGGMEGSGVDMDGLSRDGRDGVENRGEEQSSPPLIRKKVGHANAPGKGAKSAKC